ncbi:uncharacterized protein LOC8085670 [Sorghum bicolor]|uniref:uncharacterized protein LOC8085670 n=1 Tax=Sorghum bicolor TaxID=4558 RepID=UPI000B42372E|nr:uncharacterized protein LOC8085670 [Sorghum bicolor]|eukprot:XP_021307742.1 uncharacterized protein LOC8085670 [Sorghum bicolor]
MSQASSSYGGRATVRRVMCPNCHVLANRFISSTVNNNNRVFHKCPYFAVAGCQYYQWEDEMDQVAAPAPLHAVPLQAVPPPAAISTAAPVALIQDGSQAAGHGGNAQDYSRVMQQLKWMEKMIFVCIFLALYAIFKK